MPVRLERDGSRIVFGWMRQPPVAAEEFDRAEELLALLGVEESGLPVELYRQGPGHVYIELDSPEAVAALRPDSTRCSSSARTAPPASRATARAGRRASSSPRTASPRIPRPARPPGRSRSTSLGTAGSRFGDEIEIHQGAEIGRPSTLYAVARSPEEVEVGGSAVIVARGEFRL